MEAAGLVVTLLANKLLTIILFAASECKFVAVCVILCVWVIFGVFIGGAVVKVELLVVKANASVLSLSKAMA